MPKGLIELDCSFYNKNKNHNICIVSDCHRKSRCNSYCEKHYLQYRKYGDEIHTIPKGVRAGLKFLLRYAKSATDVDCVLWPYPLFFGYGRVQVDGRTWRAHRLSCFLYNGPPPTAKHMACHKPIICHNRACVNPNHLYWGTAKDNGKDTRIDGSHIKGINHKSAKLNPQKVKEIRFLLSTNEMTMTDIGRMYGVSRQTVASIRDGCYWAHVS